MKVIQIPKSLSDEDKSWPQILAIISGALAVVTSGFLFAWGSPFLTRIIEDKETYNINESQASYLTVLNFVTMLFCPLLVPLIDVIGRKKVLLLTAIPFTISILIKAFNTNLWLFYVSRLCYGLGDGMLYCTIPVYIGEVATPDVRGIWGNAFSIGALVGHFSVNVVGTFLSLQTTFLIALCLPILFVATFSFMPETPYYFLMKGKDEEAKESLRWLRHNFNVDKEYEQIKAAVIRQMSETGTWRDLFCIKANRRALIAGVFLRVSQQFSGFFVFNTYTAYIFEKSGSNVDSHASAIMYTGLVLILFTISSIFSDKLGRRNSYMLSIFVASIVLFGEAIFFYLDLKHPEINMESIKWFPLAGMLSFAVVASFGVGNLPSLMCSELFSASIKSKGVSLVIMTYAIGIFIVNNIFFYLNSYFGMYVPFFLFACCDVVSTILTYYIVPETKRKTLEEIQQYLKNM